MANEEVLDFAELKKDSVSLTDNTVADEPVLTDAPIPESIMNAPMGDGNLSIDSEGIIITDDDVYGINTEEPYNGPGMIIDTPKEKAPTAVRVGPMADEERVQGINNTLAEMDEESGGR